MKLDDCRKTSPIIATYRELQAIRPNWYVEIGHPRGTGWIDGTDFRTAIEGPFNTLLSHIGERLHTTDRRTIAASFALRYGWSSGVAIAPYILHQCVPEISLENMSFKFNENTLFERVALHQPKGVMLQQDGVAHHPFIQFIPTPKALLSCLRTSLVQQAQPVIDALYGWSRFSIRGIWGMITSSWGSQFMNICDVLDEQKNGLACVLQLFEGDDLVSQMQPHFYPITYSNITHMYHRRASCCRYYRLEKRQYSASCPLISQEDRMQRNQAWMKHILEHHSH